MCVHFIVLADNKLSSHNIVQKQSPTLSMPTNVFSMHFVPLNLKYAQTKNEIYAKSVLLALYNYVEMA